MINTSNCIIKHPIENLNTENWQQLVNMMAELFDAASGVIVQYRQQSFNVVATSENANNFLEVNATWPWDIKSFCRRIVETNDKLYVKDALGDEEWADAPPVANGPVRSYLGYPLLWPDGSLFGSFCVIDSKVTNYSSALEKALGQLKLIVENDLRYVTQIIRTNELLAEKVAQEKQLKKLALYDQLTDCANRNLLIDRVDYQIAQAQRNNSQFSLVYFDLDKFKPINDNYGHQCGDLVLTNIGKEVKAAVRETDTLARVGGDEFVIVMNKKINNNKIKQKLLETIEMPIQYGDITVSVTASIGIASYPDDGETVEALLAAADTDMYSDKVKNILAD
jgi:diguanylate cyclase (GGDEF)-like protein